VRAAATLVVLALAACGHDAAETAPAAGRGAGVVSAPPSAPVARPSLAPIGTRPFERARPSTPSPTLAAGEWRGRTTQADVAPPPPVTVTTTVIGAPHAVRDLPSELRALVGEPVSCVPPTETASLPEHVHLTISATASPTGIVTDGYVGGNLPAPVLECLTHRILSAHFPAGVPDAPRTISTTADYDRAPRPAQGATDATAHTTRQTP